MVLLSIEILFWSCDFFLLMYFLCYKFCNVIFIGCIVNEILHIYNWHEEFIFNQIKILNFVSGNVLKIGPVR